MFPKIRKHFRKTIEEVYPNQDHSLWHKISSHLFPPDEKGKKKSKIGDLQPPLVSLCVIYKVKEF